MQLTLDRYRHVAEPMLEAAAALIGEFLWWMSRSTGNVHQAELRRAS